MPVTVQSAIEDELPFFRAEAEARMVDTFDIKVASGGWVFDGTSDVEALNLLFTTKGRVRTPNGLAVRDLEVGGRTAAQVTRQLHIPVHSASVPVGAIAVCTAVHSTSDPSLLGAKLRLSGPAPGSQTTARRLEVTEVLS